MLSEAKHLFSYYEIRFFTDFITSIKERFFAMLRMTEGEGYRMTKQKVFLSSLKCFFSVIFLIIIFSVWSCKKKDIAPVPIIIPVTLNTEYISHTSKELKFKVRCIILDSRTNYDLTEIELAKYLYIASYTGQSGTNYTFSLDSLTKVNTPFLGNYSAAIMLDESEIDESQFNLLGGKYMLNQETACRKFFKLASDGSEFILSAYGLGNEFIPNQPLTIYGDNFTNNDVQYDQTLAYLRKYSNYKGNAPFLLALDSMLEFMNIKATNSNKQIIAFTHNDDSVSGKDWDSLILKAINYHITVNIVMTYQSNGDFYNYTNIAQKTGGFIFYVSNNQDGTNMPLFANRLNEILQGNFTCFESKWTETASTPVFVSNYSFAGYMELYVDNLDKLYTYMPYFISIP